MLRHFKNIRTNFPVTISLEANKQDTLLCLVLALQHYLEVNKTGQGPLFQFPGGSPVTHAFVSKNLSKILYFIGLDTRTYKGHSFRIGAATHAAKLGLSELYIKQLGRWNSNATAKIYSDFLISIMINKIICLLRELNSLQLKMWLQINHKDNKIHLSH